MRKLFNTIQTFLDSYWKESNSNKKLAIAIDTDAKWKMPL